MAKDLRHFDSYDEGNKLNYQPVLHEKLISLGLEVNDKRIITAKNYGVPVTTILLLMRDSWKSILNAQKRISEKYKIKTEQNTSTDFFDKLGITQSTPSLYNNVKWDVRNTLDINDSGTVSGSGVFCIANWYLPNDAIPKPIFNYLATTNKNVLIGNDFIKYVNLDDTIPENLFDIYKAAMLFIEFSYLLHQRIIKYEIENFKTFLKKDIDKVDIPQSFNSCITMRGSYMHNTFPQFQISIGNEIKIADNKIVDLFSESFNSACKWVNLIYKEMIKKLNES